MDKDKSCTLGGACGVGLLGILCPFCIPAVATFLFSLGLGFVVNEGVLWGIFALFSLVFLIGLFSGYQKHQNIVPLFLGILGLISTAIGAYILFSRPLMWGGVTAAVLAALWNILLLRRRTSS